MPDSTSTASAAIVRRWSRPSASPAHAGRRQAILGGLLALLTLAFLVAAATVALFHLQLNPVLTGSMRPGIQPGDLVVTIPVEVEDLQAGDVISFFPPGATTAVIHRLVSLDRREDGTWITSQGDANPVADPWGEVRLRGTTAWRHVATVPLVGFIPMSLQGIRGSMLMVAGLVVGAVVVSMLREGGPVLHPRVAGRRPRRRWWAERQAATGR